jgi:hypothetical protein
MDVTISILRRAVTHTVVIGSSKRASLPYVDSAKRISGER